MKKLSVSKIAMAGVLTALCLAVTLLIRIPLVPSVPFLQYDGKDTLIAMAGFVYGPGFVVLVSILTSLLEVLFMGGTPIDVLMNVISTVCFAGVAAYIYRRNHTKTGAVLGLLAGTIACTLSMLVWNYIMDPIYFRMPREAVVGMLPAIGLFNVLKCAINSGITLFIYKPVVTALRGRGLIPQSEGVSSAKSLTYVGAFLAISAAALCLCLL